MKWASPITTLNKQQINRCLSAECPSHCKKLLCSLLQGDQNLDFTWKLLTKFLSVWPEDQLVSSLSTLLESPVPVPVLPRAVRVSLGSCCTAATPGLTQGMETEGLQGLGLLSQITRFLFVRYSLLAMQFLIFLRGTLVIENVLCVQCSSRSHRASPVPASAQGLAALAGAAVALVPLWGTSTGRVKWLLPWISLTRGCTCGSL